MKAILEHELSLQYHSLKAYVFAAFLLVATGLGSLIYNINASVSNFEYVLGFISVILIILIPLLTMSSMSEEKKQRTDQLLLSLPLTSGQIIVGKFLALTVVLLVPMAFICVYPLIFSRYGDVYMPASYGCILAFYFLALALTAIGMFISCLTESPAMAAGISVAVIAFLYFSGSLADYVSSTTTGSLVGLGLAIVLVAGLVRALTKSNFAMMLVGALLVLAVVAVALVNAELLEGLLPAVMEKLSLFDRFNTFVNGVFDLTAIVYDLSIVVFFLFLCVQALEKRRYNG